MKQRYSEKREAIYACLRETDTHPTADWIFQQLRPRYPDLSLATVYRNLSQMRASGRIQSVGVVDGQERFDADLSPHTHFICTGCQSVRDLPYIALPLDTKKRAEDYGLHITGISLQLTGLCPRCRRTLS